MIKYELAKELRDAGFDQKNHMLKWELDKEVLHNIGYHLTADDPEEVYESGQLINKARYTSIFGKEWILSEEGLNNTVYIPTLSELIDACKDEENKKWHDFYLIRESNKWSAGRFHSGIKNVGTGNTPEEAVAKLWLALNKKQDE